jgi:hypothetical protein
MAHLPQVAEWDSIGNAVPATEDCMVDSAFKLMCHAQQDGAVLKQMTLPRRHGGLDLRRRKLRSKAVQPLCPQLRRVGHGLWTSCVPAL